MKSHNQIFVIHSVSHSQTWHFTIICLLYTEFQIQRYNNSFQILIHKISQLDIRYSFSFIFLNIALHNFIFVIDSVRHSNIFKQFRLSLYINHTFIIHSLYIRYTFSFTSLYIEFHNQIFIIHSVSHSKTQHFTIIYS